MTIFIGGAWPYANGSLHIGHIAGLLPGDLLARYYRLKGEEVLYVSGSDCHGTPISIRAAQENVAPNTITDRYHKEFADSFKRLGFSYDLYSRTDQPFHHEAVKGIFLELLKKGIIYSRTVEQTYCEHCNCFLPDRYIEGTCPNCGNPARGDQCDYCSSLLDPSDLKDKRCKLCGNEPAVRPSEHFFLALSRFQKELEEFVERSEGWRENAVGLTKRYLAEGLQDRAATRDLPWGIDVPLKGFEGKKIYVWIEAVSGYLSASRQWAADNGTGWEKFWKDGSTHYYVHGKDNIPFHTLILPAILLGLGGLKLPDRIISSEYLTLEGRKISTSRNWAVWVPGLLDRYNPDSVRYFLTINGPDKRDTDFSWREFINSNNGELLGAFGNFVNRSLVFVHKAFDGKVPEGKTPEEIRTRLAGLYAAAGEKIEAGEFKAALEEIFTFVRSANKYFDERKPWIQVKEDRKACADTISACVQIIANLSSLLQPFIPFACEKIKGFLGICSSSWSYAEVSAGRLVGQVEILFERIDREREREELGRLCKSNDE